MNTFCTEQYDFSYFSFGDIGQYFFVSINMFKGDSSFFFLCFFSRRHDATPMFETIGHNSKSSTGSNCGSL